ncbi:DUF106 domain-containing protein [Candidatus Woesearchaeota archaeon]|nr:DUF106 domain-containing protein [Candidatus Woesearchaeota archaeon]
MGLLNILDPVMNALLGPVLRLNYLLGIIILSVVLSAIITLVYKWTTNQQLMKSLKEDLKKLQEDVKKFQKDDPKKALDKQKVFMQKNMEYMKHSFKSTFYTIIPLLLIFGWMQANIAYLPLAAGEPFDVVIATEQGFRGTITAEPPTGITVIGDAAKNVTGRSTPFTLQGDTGVYDVVFDVGGELHSKEVKISSWRDYSPTIKSKKGFFASAFGWLYTSKAGYLDPDGAVFQIIIKNKPVKPFGALSIFGWQPGWLAAYIIFSIITSMGMRKVLKVY